MGIRREAKPPTDDGLDEVRRLIRSYEAVREVPGPYRADLLARLTKELRDIGPVACGPWVWRYSRSTDDVMRSTRDKMPACQLAGKARSRDELNPKALLCRQSGFTRRGHEPGSRAGNTEVRSSRGVKL